MVASKGGAPAHPLWYYNVRANSRVELQDGPRKQEMIAREISGDERAQWWKRAVAAYPPYAEYQAKTAREIPVFVLEPAGS
jgi:F420H(2)-dependent quinone reductase